MGTLLAIGTPGYLTSGGVGVSAVARVSGAEWSFGLACASRVRLGAAVAAQSKQSQPKHIRPTGTDLPTTGMPPSALERRP
jgi:hypothetical protein